MRSSFSKFLNLIVFLNFISTLLLSFAYILARLNSLQHGFFFHFLSHFQGYVLVLNYFHSQKREVSTLFHNLDPFTLNLSLNYFSEICQCTQYKTVLKQNTLLSNSHLNFYFGKSDLNCTNFLNH